MRALFGRLDVRVSAVYGIVATLWIILSDSLLALIFAGNPTMFTAISLWKGIGFVLVTASALFAVLSAELRKRDHLEQALQNDLAQRVQMERVLRDSEEKFRLLMETAPEAIVLADNDGRIVLTNPQAEKTFGYARNEVIGQSIEMLIPQRFRVVHAAHRGSFATAEGVHRMRVGRELAALHRDGHEFPVEVGLSAVETINGMLIAAFVVDITERKQVERQLEYQALLLANASDAIISTDFDFNILSWNEAAEAIYGWRADEVLHQSIDLLKTESPGPSRDEMVQQFRQHAQWKGEVIQYRKDGTRVDVHSSVAMVTDGQGNQVGVVAVNRDITERKRAEEALKGSEIKYRRLFESAQDGILILDASSGGIVDINPYLADLLGYPVGEYSGKKLWEIGAFRDTAASKISFAELQDRKYVRYDDLPLETRDGRLISVEFVSNVYWAEGQQVIQCNIRNITGRKQAEQQALEAERLRVEIEMEREVIQLKERFISVVSHEFRTPLSVIMSSAELVQRYRERMTVEKLFNHIEEIMSQSRFMVGLLEDVLTVNKARAGRIEFKPAAMDLKAFCEGIAERVQPVEPDKHQLVLRFEGQLDNVVMDSKLLQHILVNLLSNAIKYSPSGGDIRFEVHRQADAVQFTISDPGIGIPPEAMERLYEPFNRADNTGSIGGTGLGLAIVKESVDLHGGTIACDSRVGVGTTFTVRLPAGSVTSQLTPPTR